MSRIPGPVPARWVSGVLPLLVAACGAPPGRPEGARAKAAPSSAAPTTALAAPAADWLRVHLRSTEPGCVAVSADGARALIVVEVSTPDGPARALHRVSLTEEPEVFPLGSTPAEVRAEAEALWAGDVLAAWRAGEPPLPCTFAAASASGELRLPVGTGVTLAASAFAVVARPAALPAGTPADVAPSVELWSAAEREPDDTSEAELLGAYFAPDRPNFFVALRRRPGDTLGDAAGTPAVVWIRPVAGAELGVAPCAARPVGGSIATPPPRPFAAEAPGEACLAMTPDGRHAAFRLHRSDRFADDETGQGTWVAWFGEGPAPAIDLACLANRCTRKQLTRIARDAAAHGLVQCQEVGETVVVAGAAVPFFEAAGAFWLRLPDGPRFARRLRTSAHDGSDHEAFAGAWQAGSGPVFVALENADTGLSELRVAVLDEKTLGLCPADPAVPTAPRSP